MEVTVRVSVPVHLATEMVFGLVPVEIIDVRFDPGAQTLTFEFDASALPVAGIAAHIAKERFPVGTEIAETIV